MVSPFVEALLIAISSILIAILLCENRNTHIFRLILYASISFYVLILLLFHLSGYIDLFFACGIKKPFFVAVLLITLSTFFLIVKKGNYRKYIQSFEFKIDGTDRTILCLYCLFYVCYIIYKLFSYPSSWDGNAYHLPLAIKFLQSDSLSKVPPIWHFSMPSNADAVFSYFSTFRIPKLLNFSQLFLLFGLLIWSLDFNRKYLKLNQSASLMATIILLSMPAIFQGVFGHYVDFFGAVFLYFSVTTALLLLTDNGEYHIKYSFLSGLFYGISVGTKLTYIVFSPVVGLILLYAIFFRGKDLCFKDFMKALLAFIGGFILLSSFWYVRNYCLFDNPLYPLNVPLFNFEGVPIESIVNEEYQFRFIQNNPLGWILYPFTEKHPTGEYAYSYGPLFAIVVIPCYIISLGHSAYNIKMVDSKNLILLHIISASCIILWFFFLSRQPRFIMIAPIIMVSTVGYAFEHIITNKKRIFKYIILLFSGLIFIFYSFNFISQASFFIRYKYSPFNWEANYNIPVDSKIIREKGIINLNQEPMNFALYGPKFCNVVITTQEVLDTIYGKTLTFEKKNQLPSFTDTQINTLYQKYGNKFIYSNSKLSNENLTLYKAGVQAYPNKKWLNNYIYEFNKKVLK